MGGKKEKKRKQTQINGQVSVYFQNYHDFCALLHVAWNQPDPFLCIFNNLL